MKIIQIFHLNTTPGWKMFFTPNRQGRIIGLGDDGRLYIIMSEGGKWEPFIF